jgi:hypothetical protein
MLATTRLPLNPIALAVLALAALLGAPQPATAQTTRDVEPYFVTLIEDDVLLRSGDLRSFYPIATLKNGTVLRVTGESQRWLRVEYPRGLHALVRADHATLNQATGMVTLSRTDALKALSDTRYGVDGSFRDIQGPPTPATTQLKHHRTETSSRGIVFYVVDAPKGAAGFVETAQTRRATPSEIRAHQAALAEAGEQQGTEQATPQGEQVTPAFPIEPAPASAERDNAANDTSAPAGGNATLMEPMTIGNEGGQAQQTPAQRQDTPRRQPTPQPTQPTQAPAQEPVELEVRTQTPGERALDPLPSLEALSAAFDAVRRQGTLEAEVDELVAAFERVLANTPDSADNESVRTWLQQRLGLLEIRKDLQKTLQEVAEARSRLEAGNEQTAEAMARLNASRIYDFVGRLEKSAVYNGNRLPLMYRLVSVGEGIPRTLGYIEPAEGLDLERKLGVLVGVSGAATRRADLRLSTIGASSVVVLRSEEADNVRYATEPQN